MRATLTFDLPEERVEHLWAVRSGDMAAAISDLNRKLRAWSKYGHDFKHTDDLLEEIRGVIRDVIPLACGEE
jgi:hypothetical protein